MRNRTPLYPCHEASFFVLLYTFPPIKGVFTFFIFFNLTQQNSMSSLSDIYNSLDVVFIAVTAKLTVISLIATIIKKDMAIVFLKEFISYFSLHSDIFVGLTHK